MARDFFSFYLDSGATKSTNGHECKTTWHDDPSDPLFGEPYPCWCEVKEVEMTYARDRLAATIAEIDFTMVKAGRF